VEIHYGKSYFMESSADKTAQQEAETALRRDVERSKIKLEGSYFITPKTFALLQGNIDMVTEFDVIVFSDEPGRIGPFPYTYKGVPVSAIVNSTATKGSILLSNGTVLYLASSLVGDPIEE
jgi:hypothetical protein